MKPIIVELAGRDSVVALLKFAEDVEIGQGFVLTVVKPPTEDDSDFILNLGEILQIHLENLGHRVLGMININDISEYWFRLLNVNTDGRYKNIYSPCIACHALCHLMRIPVMKKFDTSFILTGERLKHQNHIKENQNQEILDIYDNIFNKFGVEFIRPVRDIISTEIIEQRYNEFCDQYGFDYSNELFRKCVITNKSKSVPSGVFEYCMDGLLPELSLINDELNQLYKEGGII